MDAHRFSPTIALLTLARAAEVEVARILEPAGLSVRKLVVLQRLASVPGASPADLARSVGITADEVAPMLRAMITTELIRRGRDGSLAITERGERALQQVDVALAAVDEHTFADRAALSAALFEDATPQQAARMRHLAGIADQHLDQDAVVVVGDQGWCRPVLGGGAIA